ncbi:MAG: DUF2079 domain-containing protein [Gaiellaceae bacterium]
MVWSASALFAAVFGTAAVLRHRTFESGRFDLGNMTQAVWSTAHGDVLSVTDVQGEQISRLGSHFDPILAALAPLWWIWPSPEALLVLQAVAVAAAAIPLYLLARRHLPEWPAAAVAGAYLLFPPVQWLTVSDFHPVALATPLLLAAWYALDAGRLWPFALCAAAAIAAKEHVGLAVACIGAWYALERGERRSGAVIAIVAGSVAVVAALVIVPAFAPAGGAFEGRYEDPSLDGRDLGYLLRLLLPLALIPLGAAAALLAAIPELLLNVLSSVKTQTSVQTHYAATIAPALLVATVFAVRRLGSRTAFVGLGAALVGSVLLGPVGRIEIRANTHDAALRRAVALVPEDAAVSATNALGAHLSARKRILSFPILFQADWVAIDTTRLTYLDSLRPDRSRRPLAGLRRDRSWRLVFEEDGVLVLRRR